MSGWSGVDFSEHTDLIRKIEYIEKNAVRSILESLTKSSPDKKWTVVCSSANFARDRWSMGPVTVGTPKKIADKC